MTNSPSIANAEREIPPQVADMLQVAFDFNDPPATLGEWAADITQLPEEKDMEVGLEAMCTAESPRHSGRIGDEMQHFHCVLDTLLLPFVVETQQEFAIESRSPISDEVIEIHVSRDSIGVVPDDAYMSFGIERGVELPADDDISPAYAYNHLCPYINAFLSRAEYEEWAADNPDAVTMGFPLTDGFELAMVLEESPTNVTE